MFGYRLMAKKLDILIFPSICEKHCTCTCTCTFSNSIRANDGDFMCPMYGESGIISLARIKLEKVDVVCSAVSP